MLHQAESDDLEVNPGSPRMSLFSNAMHIGPRGENPYLKYLKKIRVAASEAGRGQNLASKSEEMTNRMIRTFLEWYNSLGGATSKSAVDEATLQRLFQIGFDSPLQQTGSTNEAELRTLPQDADGKVAVSRGERRSLHSLRSSRADRLQDMSQVWNGIESLWSTVAFCSWLGEHPEVNPPSYLKRQGLIGMHFNSVVTRSEELGGVTSEGRLLLPPRKEQLCDAAKDNHLNSTAAASSGKFIRPCRKSRI